MLKSLINPFQVIYAVQTDQDTTEVADAELDDLLDKRRKGRKGTVQYHRGD